MFNNLGLALGTNLKFYTSMAKRLKLKVRKFWGLILIFVEVTEEKLVGFFWIRLNSELQKQTVVAKDQCDFFKDHVNVINENGEDGNKTDDGEIVDDVRHK